MALVVPDPFPEHLYCKKNSEYVVGEEGEGEADDIGEFDSREEEDQSWAGCGRVLAVHMPGATGAAAQSARGQGSGRDRRGGVVLRV